MHLLSVVCCHLRRRPRVSHALGPVHAPPSSTAPAASRSISNNFPPAVPCHPARPCLYLADADHERTPFPPSYGTAPPARNYPDMTNPRIVAHPCVCRYRTRNLAFVGPLGAVGRIIWLDIYSQRNETAIAVRGRI